MILRIDNQQLLTHSKVRNSGVELLRLFAILGVVFIHFSDRALPVMETNSIITNLHITLFLRSLFSSAVDVFLIISGFFLVKSNIRTIGKPLDLIWQVCFFQGLFYVVLAFLGREPFGLFHIMVAAVPDCYYAILFVVLYLLSPYLNRFLNGLNQKELKRFMVIVLLFFSAYSVLTTLFNQVSNKEWMGLNTIGAWGSQSGFNIVNFMLCYSVGAFIRLYELPEKLLRTKILLLLLFFSTFAVFGWAEIDQKLPIFGMRSAWVYDNPFVILQGVFLFLLSKKVNFHSMIINLMAKAIFAMFIIHCLLIWYYDIEGLCEKPWYIFIGGYLLFAVCSFAISFIVYYVYRGMFKPLFDKLDKKEIWYFEKN